MTTFTSEMFTTDETYFYSPVFLMNSGDTNITIQVWLSENGTALVQGSLNESDWLDIADSSFACEPIGLQSYIDGHYGLPYRLKIDKLPTQVQIMI